MSMDQRFYRDAFAVPGDDADRRAQIERHQQERAEERQQQIALQSSPLSGPEERIQLWEKLHALKLPQSATHRLVHVIAAQTKLSIQEILDAQRERSVALAARSLPAAS